MNRQFIVKKIDWSLKYNLIFIHQFSKAFWKSGEGVDNQFEWQRLSADQVSSNVLCMHV